MYGIKVVLGLVLVVAFLALEWMAASSGMRLLSWIPLGALAALWWSRSLALVPRMAYAALAGFIIDLVSGTAFGSTVVLLLLMGGVAEILRVVLSAHDSRAAQGVSAAVMLTFFFLLTPLASRIAGII